MEPEEQKMLRELYDISKENRRDIKRIRTHMRLGTMFRVLYWFVIIGAAIGLFYFIQPFIDNALGVYTDVTDRVDTVTNLFGGQEMAAEQGE